MARHWSAFVSSVSQNQAYALDKMAMEHDLKDGMEILMQLTGYSRSKVGRLDYLSMRHILDRAFELYGRR